MALFLMFFRYFIKAFNYLQLSARDCFESRRLQLPKKPLNHLHTKGDSGRYCGCAL